MTQDGDPQPGFRKGFDALRRAQETDEVNRAHDLIIIRHHLETSDWPEPALDFVRSVISYFPDADTDEPDADGPDWSASEVLDRIVWQLANAMEASGEPTNGG